VLISIAYIAVIFKRIANMSLLKDFRNDRRA